MTIALLLVLGAVIFFVLRKGSQSGQGSPKEDDPTKFRYYLNDQNLLPKLEKFDVLGMEWWPSSVVARDNWSLEKVKLGKLQKSEARIEVGAEFEIDCWSNKVNADAVVYGDAFDYYEHGTHYNQKKVTIKLAQAIAENRLGARVREIDNENKEVEIMLYALDKPLPWDHKQAKGFSIPKKSFDKLLAEASSAQELDEKLREWWKKRDERAAKKAAKKG